MSRPPTFPPPQPQQHLQRSHSPLPPTTATASSAANTHTQTPFQELIADLTRDAQRAQPKDALQVRLGSKPLPSRYPLHINESSHSRNTRFLSILLLVLCQLVQFPISGTTDAPHRYRPHLTRHTSISAHDNGRQFIFAQDILSVPLWDAQHPREPSLFVALHPSHPSALPQQCR